MIDLMKLAMPVAIRRASEGGERWTLVLDIRRNCVFKRYIPVTLASARLRSVRCLEVVYDACEFFSSQATGPLADLPSRYRQRSGDTSQAKK